MLAATSVRLPHYKRSDPAIELWVAAPQLTRPQGELCVDECVFGAGMYNLLLNNFQYTLAALLSVRGRP